MKSNTNLLRYQYNCVHPYSVEELNYIVDNSSIIKYQTFITKVDRYDLYKLKQSLGYAKSSVAGITLKHDPMVTYHKSKLPNGSPVYYLAHSGFEHIFY